MVMERTATVGVTLELANAADVPGLVEMVRRHEGEASAGIAEHWLVRQRDVVVARGAAGREPLGFVLIIALERATLQEVTIDPCALACWRYLDRRAPLRQGERASLARYWITQTGQDLDSPVLASLGAVLAHHHATLPGLAFSFMQVHDPLRFAPLAEHSDFETLEEARAEVDGRRYGVFGKDWRQMPQDVWMRRMEARMAGLSPDEVATNAAVDPTALDRESFAAAVRVALVQLQEPQLLARSSLLHTRMVATRLAAADTPAARVEALSALIRQAAESLAAAPRNERSHRALVATYLEPVGTQEGAAEETGLSFSTYRRHLHRGIEAVVDTLWLMESSASP
jgi:hypothetical protein